MWGRLPTCGRLPIGLVKAGLLPQGGIQRRVVTALRADHQILASFQLDLDRVIQSVGLHRLRAVQHVVLMPQLIGDVLERLRQIRRLEREERLAAGLLREVFQDLVAVGFDVQ